NLHSTYATTNVSLASSTKSKSSDFHLQSQHHRQQQRQQQKQFQYKLTAGNEIAITDDTVDTDDTVKSFVVSSSTLLLNNPVITNNRRVFFRDQLSAPATIGTLSIAEVCTYNHNCCINISFCSIYNQQLTNFDYIRNFFD
uniref:Uncharacterized protein n=1 Tax=Onchocerca volvulus TaxID=6282 RepID=A0A8R1TPZ9_ONCVO